MKKLVYFAKNMNIGGVEKALVDRINATDFSENRVTLVLEKKSGELLSALDGRVRIVEYRLSRFSTAPLRKAENLLKRMIWKLNNGGKFDYSCSFCTYSVIGSRLAQYASECCELWVHNNYSAIYPDINDFKAFFDELRVSRFNSLVFVSNEALEGFLRVYPELEECCRVENNTINEKKIRRLAEEPLGFDFPEGKTIFIYIGRLEETQKRISRLLQAFKYAKEKREDISLWIIGDGPDRQSFETLASTLGISSDVLFLGPQLNPYKFLKSADCLVLSSDYEGFPVVYQEAMLLGKGIITTVPASNGKFDIKEHAVIVERRPEAIAAAMAGFGVSQ